MNTYLRDQLAREIFEDIKPGNPHGPQSDLYFGMPYCSHQTQQARNIADRILNNFKVVEENAKARKLIEEARNAVVASFNSPNRQFCTPGCPSGEHAHDFNSTEALLIKLADGMEDLLPPAPNPAQPVIDAIEKVKKEVLAGHRASITIDLDTMTEVALTPREPSRLELLRKARALRIKLLKDLGRDSEAESLALLTDLDDDEENEPIWGRD